MLLSLWTSSVLALGAVDHPAHHPANAELYIDVPDVQAIVQAYANAPLVKMLGDESVSKIGGVTSSMGWDLKSIFESVLPKADPNRPDDRFWPWSAMTHLSLSVAGLSAAQSTGVSAWFVVDFKDVAAATQTLAAIGASSEITKVAIKDDEKLAYGGHDLSLQRFEASLAAPHTPLWLVQSDARLIGGLGHAQPAELAARFAQPGTSFVDKAKALAEDAGFTPSAGVTIVRAWSGLEHVDLSESLKKGAPISSDSTDELMSELLPFYGAQGKWRLQLRRDRFVSESLFTRIGHAKALDKLFGLGPISAACARMVPKEAVGAWVVKVKPDQVEAQLESLLARSQGPGAAGTDAPRMSSALGDSAAIYMMPFGPMSSPISFGAAVELKDAALFQKAFEGWIEDAKKADPLLTVEVKPYHKVPMYAFSHGDPDKGEEKGSANGGGNSFMGLDPQAMLRPCLAILPDRVVMTSNRTLAHNEIKRFEAKTTDAHAIAAEGRIPQDAFEASTMDWGALLGKAYDMARGLLPMAMQNSEKKIDVNALPTSAQLFRFFQPSFSFSKRVDTKIYTYSESSFGPETPLAIGGLAFLGGHAMSHVVEAPAAGSPATVDKPAEKAAEKPAAPNDSAKKITLEALRTVKTGLAVCKSDAGRYPDALDQLLKGSVDFPQGYLEGGVVPKDGWGHALVYTSQENGAKYKLFSCGPDGIDQGGAGDDVSAP